MTDVSTIAEDVSRVNPPTRVQHPQCCTSCGARQIKPEMRCMGCKIKDNSVFHPSGCWIWNGAKRKDYGVMRVPGVGLQGAHRVSWAVWRGDAPNGALVEQTCGNRDCVNPNHLVIKVGPTLWDSLGF